MTKFKKYVKLRKYIDGEPTDEIKKGNLIGVVESDSKEACEKGETS